MLYLILAFLAGILFTLGTLFSLGWYAFRHPDLLAAKMTPIIMKMMMGK